MEGTWRSHGGHKGGHLADEEDEGGGGVDEAGAHHAAKDAEQREGEHLAVVQHLAGAKRRGQKGWAGVRRWV
eukprot:5854186-Prymnesium_polylepis.1